VRRPAGGKAGRDGRNEHSHAIYSDTVLLLKLTVGVLLFSTDMAHWRWKRRTVAISTVLGIDPDH
jgi:hypothetical protein